jgi:hypothetical protein
MKHYAGLDVSLKATAICIVEAPHLSGEFSAPLGAVVLMQRGACTSLKQLSPCAFFAQG